MTSLTTPTGSLALSTASRPQPCATLLGRELSGHLANSSTNTDVALFFWFRLRKIKRTLQTRVVVFTLLKLKNKHAAIAQKRRELFHQEIGVFNATPASKMVRVPGRMVWDFYLGGLDVNGFGVRAGFVLVERASAFVKNLVVGHTKF